MHVRTAPSHPCVVRARRARWSPSVGLCRVSKDGLYPTAQISKVHFAPYFSALVSLVDRVLNCCTALVTGSGVPSA